MIVARASSIRSALTATARLPKAPTASSLLQCRRDVLNKSNYTFQNAGRWSTFHTTARTFQPSLASRLAQKAWYRKDGTPRSKIRGAVYTLIGSCLVLVSISALEVMEDLQDLIYQLAAMLQVQRVVYEDYNLVDFSDYRQTAEYFRSLSTPFLLTAQETDEDTVNHFFDHLVNLDNEASGQLKERVHVRMKEAAAEVHHFMQGIKDQPLDSFQSVVKVMREALYEVITDVAVEADERVAALVKAFKDDPGKPPPPKGRSYELIG